MKANEYVKLYLEEKGIKYNEEDKFIFFIFSDNFFVAEERKEVRNFLRLRMRCRPLNELPFQKEDVLQICNLLNGAWPFIKFHVEDDLGYIMCSVEKEENEMQEHGIKNVESMIRILIEGYLDLLRMVKLILERRS